MKTLNNTDIEGAKENVSDIEVFGDGDTFKLICKASSEEEGWMKSTKAMEIPGRGCVIQVTTQQRNSDGSYAIAEAITVVLGVTIVTDHFDGEIVGRRIVSTEIAKKLECFPSDIKGEYVHPRSTTDG